MRFQPLLEVAPGEFVGRSAEEAVDRARSALGVDAKVRCWKTRRGGVLGFFAREVYVAGIKQPDSRSDGKRRHEESAASTPSALADVTLPMLEDLVASTTDEVSYGADEAAVEDRAFRDVLAQAEAALSDAVFDDAVWLSDETPSSESEPVPERAIERDACRHDLDAFRSMLGSLGLSEQYRPQEQESALDGLVRSLDTLVPPPPLPRSPGSVIAVVGGRRDALAVAHEVAMFLDLDECDVIVLWDDPTACRRINRRKKSTRVSVVALEAAVRGRTFDAAREELDRLAPDFVLGVAAATLKCSDVERWQRGIGVEALALRHWHETETPAELLAALPIFSVDGVVMSTMRWVSLLLSTFVDRTDEHA
ncbi:MAG TPA: hypothetical protein VG246_10975 [Acidimicrobiales bacterium]|nr:hypothetical protein [Acidimicrobiales bacterium]